MSALADGLDYLRNVTATLLVLQWASRDVLERLDTEACGWRLAALPAASPAGWRTLARILRHVAVALEETSDGSATASVRLSMVRALHADVVAHGDRAAQTVAAEGGH